MISKNQAIEILKNGGIGVMPTDTIYGLLGQALNQKTVERIYKVRRRSPAKPLIILIASLDDLALFNIDLSVSDRDFLNSYWPGALSVILNCCQPDLAYLHCGTDSLAFRWPANEEILEVLRQTGPLVAPSANPEDEKPSINPEAAKNYFGDQIDFYYGVGDLAGLPSTLIKLTAGQAEILRQGELAIK